MNELTFNSLLDIDVSKNVEKKKVGNTSLTYLSWAWAWTEIIKKYPSAIYEIKKFENNLPYVYDEKTGYMVFTAVTIEGITHEMWLPVMDGANKAMKSEAYTYDTKFDKNKRVEAATMFDINKTIMRCLVKNLAMFGLGLYIYAGEDLPESSTDKEQPKTATKDESEKNNEGQEIEFCDIAQRNQLRIEIGTNRMNELMKEHKNKIPLSVYNELMKEES